MKLGMKKGFTLIELLVVMGILAVLFTYGSINLLSLQNKTYLNSNLITLVSDIQRQQQKSMLGETFGGANTFNFGIYFEPSQYTLFQGTVFSPSDPTNLIIPLERNIQLSSITFPSSLLVFTKGSGEVVGFVAGSNSVQLRDAMTGDQKTITFNKYGVITSIN